MSSTSRDLSSKKSAAVRCACLLDLTDLPCAQVDPGAIWKEESFLVCWWWVWQLQLLPVWEWCPCECSPVLVVGDFQFLVEVEDFAGVRVDAVDKLLEGLEAEVFFFEKCDDCLSLVSVGVKCTWSE